MKSEKSFRQSDIALPYASYSKKTGTLLLNITKIERDIYLTSTSKEEYTQRTKMLSSTLDHLNNVLTSYYPWAGSPTPSPTKETPSPLTKET